MFSMENKMDNVRKKTHVASVMNQPPETVAGCTDEKDNRPLPHKIRRPRLTAKEKNPQQIQATEMKALQTKGAQFRADTENLKIPSCRFGHLPVCQNYKSETRCKYGRYVSPDMSRLMRSPAKSQRKVVQRINCLIAGVYTIELCVSRPSSEKFYSWERRKIGIKSHRKIHQKLLAPNKNP